ncbi:DTW domain-containing protein [Roseateles chitinivorans]|uniref:DTW domain-containing protein n=1 Tax=Roseateles chitinivorans TaxID=2917965 RepID=UPI003D67648F
MSSSTPPQGEVISSEFPDQKAPATETTEAGLTAPASEAAEPVQEVDESSGEAATDVESGEVAPVGATPGQPKTAEGGRVDVQAVAAKLKELFPALFAGGAKPLKLRVQSDIQQRAPGQFTKAQLSAFLRRYTGGTGYLIALTRAKTRFDLDGQPAGELSDEHRVAAQEELTRRRGISDARRAEEDRGRQERSQLLRDFSRTTLTPANFCALKGLTQEQLDAQLKLAREEEAQQPPRPERNDRPLAAVSTVVVVDLAAKAILEVRARVRAATVRAVTAKAVRTTDASPRVNRADLPMPATEGGLSGRRPLCEGCGRPLVACWCGCVRRVANGAALLILQDADEAGHAKGTGALLARCLSRVELRVGERFEPPPSLDGFLLLYPRTSGEAPITRSPNHQTPSVAAGVTTTTLVALDGTWRGSRRLLALNPWLQALPRLALDAPPPSRYTIRRAHADTQRSTLEACALALAVLDGDESRYLPLWLAMEAFVALQRRLAGHPTPSLV